MDVDEGTFGDHPKSVAEARAERAMNAKLWSPRDALIAALREIDAGRMHPDCLVICIGKLHADGSTSNEFYSAAPNAWASIGLVSEVLKSLTAG